MMSNEQTVVLPKKAKGSRPYFFQDPAQDRLVAMLMGLVGEVSVMADRVDTLERLLMEKAILQPGQVDSYQLTAEVRAERDSRREVLLANVLRIIRQDEEDPDVGQVNDPAYMSVVNMVERD
jgi:hypothetical protein